MPFRSPLRLAIASHYGLAESVAVSALLNGLPWSQALPEAAHQQAKIWSEALRKQAEQGRGSLLQSLLQSFPLSTQEGQALMCLAEALLRLPDPATRYQLIRDKVRLGQWLADPSRQRPLVANAAIWGLSLTSKLLGQQDVAPQTLLENLQRLVRQISEPLICRSLEAGMRLLSHQFIAGAQISEALALAKQAGHRDFQHSYDMLGEAALTPEDARGYLAAYEQAIQQLGQAAPGDNLYDKPGISIKLSALHPRYEYAQREAVQDELYPSLRHLLLLARHYNISVTLDAEEANRLELSLELLERLLDEPELAGWNGIGFVVQAYQKPAPALIAYLAERAQQTQHRLMIRLVKGAYWDTEIKRAQVDGLDDYPVYTRKAHTDLAYLVCARQLLAAPEAFYPQFATHNALSIAALEQLARTEYPTAQYEFQCLYGMGEPLYGLIREHLQRPCRRYTPVGDHAALLPYLVRRLLENGANTAFINHIADPELPLDAVLADPIASIRQRAQQDGHIGQPHSGIPLPAQLYGTQRQNARGLNLNDAAQLAAIDQALNESQRYQFAARPLLASPMHDAPSFQALHNPARTEERLGHRSQTSPAQVEMALQQALSTGMRWADLPAAERAARLERAAERLEQQPLLAIALLVREAGKTQANALGEVREAVDFLRYYAAQVRSFTPQHQPLGPVLCISPWNFPLAIFIGQIAAALATGNPVLAKPAQQTPLIACFAVRLLHRAGVPRAALQLLLSPGESLGAQLLGDARIQGVLFTGSTAVAKHIQQRLATRLSPQGQPIPLIAETGGINAMIVDASALPEQAVQDVIASAYDSAGQRCSALRLLCLQDEIADKLIERLRGAMAERVLGNPQQLATDIGPVIDAAAKQQLEAYIQQQREQGCSVFQRARLRDEQIANGHFVMPTLIELKHPGDLKQEIFGPVLHWVRYRAAELGQLVEQINASGYGLTLGVQSRLDSTLELISQQARVGNLYINRSQIGAVVGVQPFGGEGYSGTGPKAGGPLYLYRLLAHYPWKAPLAALSRDSAGARLDWQGIEPHNAALLALHTWARLHDPDTANHCAHYAQHSLAGIRIRFKGPTGESNHYSLMPRGTLLCLAEQPEALLHQLAAVLATDGQVVWQNTAPNQSLLRQLPAKVQARIRLLDDWCAEDLSLHGCLIQASPTKRLSIIQQLAQRKGPILNIQALNPGEAIALEWLLVERVQTVNTTANGGNTRLATLADSPIPAAMATQNQG